MRKILYLLVAASLMLAFVPMAAVAHTEADPFATDLLAGQYMDVGDVLVWNDADMLYVNYVLEDPAWCITETHLQVATALDGIPQKNGNPIPGKFDYAGEHGCVADVSYQIPLGEWGIDTELYIAAHAVVQSFVGYDDPNLDNFAAALPAQVTMSVQYPFSGALAYFPVTTVTGDPLTGTYEGWCVDTDNVIYQATDYTANVFSSYETLPAGLVEFPENLDLVNWIINQGYVGQPSTCGGAYTYGDVQRAIWTLVDDELSTSGLGAWSQCRVDEILAAAFAEGEGFEPGCDDYVAVILQPVEGQQVITIAQVTFASVGVPCDPVFQYETAWGAGFDFPGKNWATYFAYTVQGEVLPVEWPVGGTTTVAFEDQVLGGGNDWDYNDWVADIHAEGVFWGTSTDPGTDLVQMAFTITPEVKLAGYHHVMHLDSDTFGCDGTYELERDGIPVASGIYDDEFGIDVIMVPDTNSLNTAMLTIMFDPPCSFDWSIYDPYGSYHGEGLFYDPYIVVINTGQEIHQGDVRMLTVPTDWTWPAEGQAIWLAYPKVGPATDPYAGPVFTSYWWTP